MKQLLLIILALLLAPVTVLAQYWEGPLILKHFSPETYKSSTQNWDLEFNDDGLMYVANNDGVLEYDGVSWRLIDVPSVIVRQIELGPDKIIYVGGDNELGYLAPDSIGQLVYNSLVPLLDSAHHNFSNIWRIEVYKNAVYFLSESKVFRYYKGKFKVWTHGRDQIIGLFEIENELYISKRKGGVFKVESDTIIATKSAIKDLAIRYCIYTQGNYYLSTVKDGIVKYNAKRDKVDNPTLFKALNKTLSEALIYKFEQVNDSILVAGTIVGGIFIIQTNGKLLNHITSKDYSDLGSMILGIKLHDQLWVTTEDGISRLEINSPFRTWQGEKSTKSSVYSIEKFGKDTYFSTTSEVLVYKDNQFQHVTMKADQGWALRKLHDKDGSIRLISGQNYHLSEIIGDSAKEIKASNYNYAIIETPEHTGKMWVSHIDSVCLYEYHGKQLTQLLTLPEAKKVSSFSYDLNQVLWMATFQGKVFRYQNDSLYTYSLQKEKVGGSFWNLFSYKDTFYATSKDVLFWYDELHDKFLDARDQFGITPEHGAYIMNYNSKTISIVDSVANKVIAINRDYNVEVTFDQARPFLRFSENALFGLNWQDSHNVWVGTNDGIMLFNNNLSLDYLKNIRTQIRRVTINNDSVFYHGNWGKQNDLPIDYQFNNLTFEYACQFFELEEHNTYQYKLKGYDNSWSQWTNEVRKEYTNLPYGDYEFQVRSKNIYQHTSQTVGYSFRIKTPWYYRFYAWVVYSLALIALIGLIIKWRTNKIEHEKQALETIIDGRTSYIQNQKEELQVQANQLKELYEKMLDMNKLKDGLTSMIVHDLKNPLNNIISISNANEQNLEHIKDSGKRMLTMVLNILDVQQYEEGKMVLDKKEISAYQLAKSALKQVEFLATEKRVSIYIKVSQFITLTADEEIVERVFVNLLTNAIKHSPYNSSILITNEVKSDNSIHFRVQDHGEGIPSDKNHLVFAKFGQIIAKRSGTARSSGLGLTFCKMAIEAHGGAIGFTSKLEEGTTFWFSLPGSKVHQLDEQKKELEDNIQELIHTEISGFENDLTALIPYVTLLKTYEFYQISEIRKVLKDIDDSKSDFVKSWKKHVTEAIYSGNEGFYINLLSQVVD